jgi:hypothetical protein
MSKARDMANLLTSTGDIAGTALDNVSAAQINTALFGANKWTLATVSENLVLSYNGTAKAKLESDGDIVAVQNITAYGSV